MEDYIKYLQEERKSENTIIAYTQDVKAFEKFLKEKRNVKELKDCRYSDANNYLITLDNKNVSRKSINRKASSLRFFYQFLIATDKIKENPFQNLHTFPENQHRNIDFLSIKEVNELLSFPDNSLKGLRDKALLEFLYGSGVRTSEALNLKYGDINFIIDTAVINSENFEDSGNPRIAMIGRDASTAILVYTERIYQELFQRECSDDDYIFLNMDGNPLSRQGVWKILKSYGKMMGIENKVTPGILRDTYAVHMIKGGCDAKTLHELMGCDMTTVSDYFACLKESAATVYRRCHPKGKK